MIRGNKNLLNKAVDFSRRFVVSLTVLGMLFGSAPVYAAVPTYVVEFEINTKFERSLEKFMFDLFNTLQRREEDFTAAFELQKIEKAREDVNKLFQETQEELQDFGLALDLQRGFLDGSGVRDPRLTGSDGGFGCSATPTSGALDTGAAPPGCPPVISPIKDSRIIHDPYQYLFGDAYDKGRAFTYCFFNYVAWDQYGLLPEMYGSLEFLNSEQLRTFDPTPDSAGGKTPAGSVKNVLAARNALVALMKRGNYHLLNFPYAELYGNVGDFSSRSAMEGRMRIVEPRCRQVMYTVGGESPVTVSQNLILWQKLNELSGITFTDGEEEAASQLMHSLLWYLPTLDENIQGRALGNGWTWGEFSKSQDSSNRLSSLIELAATWADKIITETKSERNATYIAGQGIRPEYLFEVHRENDNRLDFNTEYIITPAIILLQKMQAANQAMFDLAGQGFLYLDAVSTPDELLGAYNLARASSPEERKICNNAGACQLLDAWLKPAATFRSVATLGLIEGDPPLNQTDPLIPESIGPLGDYPGSGLPAPWEDEGIYLDIANEKIEDRQDNRYTVARFLNSNGGFDEFLEEGGKVPNQDNIGDEDEKLPGYNYPINDWYDRVTEMYEAGIGVNGAVSRRDERARGFTVADWQCYIGTWFSRQSVTEVSNGSILSIGGDVVYFYGTDDISDDSSHMFNPYCVSNPQSDLTLF